MVKKLDSSEKFGLIRLHGERLTKTAIGAPMTRQSDVIASAERVLELARSIPKAEWAIE